MQTVPLPAQSDWVDAAPFRAHARFLIDGSGLAWPAVAVACGVSVSLFDHLLHGRRGRPVPRLRQDEAVRLFATDLASLTKRADRWRPLDDLPGRLARLMDTTPDLSVLAQAAGVEEAELRQVLDRSAAGCRHHISWAITALEATLARVAPRAA